MAYIVSKNEDELTEIEIMEYVDENAAPHKKLRGGVAFIAAIPKSANGHVLRAELKEKYKREKMKVYVREGGHYLGMSIAPSLPIFPIIPIYFIGSYKTPIFGQNLLYFL